MISQRDRLVATGMHLGTIFAPLVAPAVVWALNRNSPFVSSHARKSLKETVVLQAVLLVLGVCSLAYTAWSLYGHYQTDWKTFSIWPVLLKAAAIWILLGILQIVNAIGAIRAGIRAYRGEWPKGVNPPLPEPLRSERGAKV